MLNPVLMGWWQYYGRFYPTEMWKKLFRYFDEPPSVPGCFRSISLCAVTVDEACGC